MKNWRSYLSRAFDFSRAFLFKWTVNWRFVGEEVFLSKGFSLALLSAHVLLLTLFVTTRWLAPSKQSLSTAVRSIFNPPGPQQQAAITSRVTPRFILTTILTANVIGMLCARSLHYQFYALLGWASPFLLWREGDHPVVQYMTWACQEIFWNAYPSTSMSSWGVVAALFFQVLLVWYKIRDDPEMSEDARNGKVDATVKK